MNARRLFDEAAEMDARDRAAFLDRVCVDAPDLRREVESLLEAHARAEGFLRERAGDPLSLAAALVHDALRPGARLERYTIVRLIGAGGMGAVYLAEQDRPRRTVALKVVRAGIADPAMVRRFEHESQVLASLQHPGIAQVYDAGTHTIRDEARPLESVAIPYFAMEHVPEARSLIEHATSTGLSRRARIELFRRVCDAMQYAHRRGVIHRDLKPGNVLVSAAAGAVDQPKIIDFGVARATGADSPAGNERTTIGQIVGTLRYMSPEQCGDDPGSIDTRSDVYALGVILYELLIGRAPYDLKSTSLAHVPRIIREMPATRPSQVDPALRGDLETIMLKALEKEPDARYQSAGALADDLGRFLESRPILARPPSVAYQFRTFARRRRALVAGALATLAMLVLGAIGTAWQAVRATEQRDLARLAEQRTSEALARAKQETARAEWSTYVADIAGADSAIKTLDAKTALGRLADAPAGARNWEWRLLERQADRSVRTWRGPANEGVVATLASPDGSRFAALLRSGELVMADAETFEPIWRARQPGEVATLYEVLVSAFSRDGSLVCVTLGDDVYVWDARAGVLLNTLRAGIRKWGFAYADFSPDRSRLVVTGRQNELDLFELPSGRLLRREAAGSPRFYARVRYMPDGKSLLVAQAGGVVVVDAETLAEERRLDWPLGLNTGGDWGPLQVSDDGRIAVAHSFNTGVALRLDTGETMAAFHGHTQRLCDTRLSGDGSRLATCAWDGTLRVWETSTGKELSVQAGHTDLFWTVSFIDHGRRLLSSSRDGTAKVWDLVPRAEPWIAHPLESDGWFMSWMPGTHEVLWSGWDVAKMPRGEAPAWGSLDAEGRRMRDASGMPSVSRGGASIALDARGALVAYCDRDDRVVVWDRLAQRERCRIPGVRSRLAQVAISPDGSTVLAQDETMFLGAWDASSGRELWRWTSGDPEGHVSNIAFKPDSSCFVVSSFDSRARVMETRTGAVVRTLWKERDPDVTVSAWSPDGRLIATGSDNGEVRFWNALDGTLARTTTGLTPACWALGFSADGTRLAVGVQDRTVRVLDVASGVPLLTLDGFTGTPTATLWSDDGRFLAVGCRDRTIRIWDAPPLGGSRPE
jgi:WD40 repeat protein